MKIVALGDNHNDIEKMLFYVEKLSSINFDFIVYTGDFSDINTPKGFSQEDIATIIIRELKTLKKPIFAVPGNNDTINIISILEKEGIGVHGKGKLFNNIGIYGFGGAKTPFRTSYEPTDEEIEKGLRNGLKDVKNANMKIQVTHTPPLNTRLDFLIGGVHVGSAAVRKIIEEEKPILAISGHIHETKGIDYIGKTMLINPGRLSEGYFGYVEIKQDHAEGKILNLIE